jgi:hypothetical protein
VTTPPSRPPRSWNGEEEVLGVVPLLRAEGGEKESQFGLVALKHFRDILLIEIRMLFDSGTRGCGDHSPITRPLFLLWSGFIRKSRCRNEKKSQSAY